MYMTYPAGQPILPPASGLPAQRQRTGALIFDDPTSKALLCEIELIAPSAAPVLINGETGTGKELIARHLHDRSRRSGAFVAVNCGAIAPSLAESEWFGHQAGAFTGANETRAGWFESADGGTLFLDEIAELSLPMQVKLLRVLQESAVVRVGSRDAIPVDIRVIAASNVDLAEAVAAGRFRPDLYYRLNILSLRVPPLRERRADIPLIVEQLLRINSTQMSVERPTLSPEAIETLSSYPWPGNVRELENVVHFAVLTARDGVIYPKDLRLSSPLRIPGLESTTSAPLDCIGAQLDRLFGNPPDDMYQTLEALIVRRAFAYCASNQVHTAKLLGVSRSVVRTMLKRLGLMINDSAEPCELETSQDNGLHSMN
jgi:DNA-binding NtrC family response regulator